LKPPGLLTTADKGLLTLLTFENVTEVTDADPEEVVIDREELAADVPPTAITGGKLNEPGPDDKEGKTNPADGGITFILGTAEAVDVEEEEEGGSWEDVGRTGTVWVETTPVILRVMSLYANVSDVTEVDDVITDVVDVTEE